MLRFAVFSLLLATTLAYNGYGARKGYNQPSYAAPKQQPAYQAPSYDTPAKSYEPQTAQLPIQSQHQMKYIDVPLSYSKPQPVNIAIPASEQPINFMMKSRSSPLNIGNYHEASQGSYEETSSEDKPHVRVHTVTRPVIQEVREVITPIRKVQQQVQAVQETSETIVAKQGYNKYAEEAPAPKPAYAPAPKPAYAPAPKPAYAPAPKPAYAPKPAPVKPAYAPAPKAAYAPAPKPAYAPKPAPKQAYAPAKPAYAPAPAPAKPTYGARRYQSNY